MIPSYFWLRSAIEFSCTFLKYWAQVALLRDTISDLPALEISTVDGFQGCEKEVIILSFVRSNLEDKVGFLRETRRINVSVTRAKRQCLAIGDTTTLWKDAGLRSFIQYCKFRQSLYDVEKFMSKFKNLETSPNNIQPESPGPGSELLKRQKPFSSTLWVFEKWVIY